MLVSNVLGRMWSWPNLSYCLVIWLERLSGDCKYLQSQQLSRLEFESSTFGIDISDKCPASVLYTEDDGSIFFRNIYIDLPHYTAGQGLSWELRRFTTFSLYTHDVLWLSQNQAKRLILKSKTYPTPELVTSHTCKANTHVSSRLRCVTFQLIFNCKGYQELAQLLFRSTDPERFWSPFNG